jgi:hypothetical protein
MMLGMESNYSFGTLSRSLWRELMKMMKE